MIPGESYQAARQSSNLRSEKIQPVATYLLMTKTILPKEFSIRLNSDLPHNIQIKKVA